MKKLSLILIFCLLIVGVLAINIFAEKGENVAIGAETSVNYPRWSIDPSKLVDGDRTLGCASNQSYPDMDYYIELDREYTISELVVVVNGVGRYPVDPAFTWTSPSNNEFWFEVRTYDEQGNETYKKGANHSTRDQNENYEVIFDLNEAKVKKITIYVVQSYNNCVGIWEVEAYEHLCKFETPVEIFEDATCSQEGNGIFKCECGLTEEKAISPTGIHAYTDIDALTYENGFLAKGQKALGCPTCDDYLNEVVSPLFKFLGYSVSRNGKSICTGYTVSKEEIILYETVNNTTLDYGFLCAITDNVTPLNADGTVLEGINGQSMSLRDTPYPRFDVRISAKDWTNIADTPLIMCAYVIDGDKLTYIYSKTNTEKTTSISYNQINLMPI